MAASSSTAPNKVDNAIRQYLASINMAPILEEFVAATVAERPDDVFAYMEEYARRKRAEIASNKTWTLVRSWSEHAGKDEASLQQFADNFFQLLFITQRTMKKTVFASIVDDLPPSALALAKVFDGFVNGSLTDAALAALAKQHAVDVPIESYQYQQIVSTVLLAVRQSMPPDVWDAVNDDWRMFCIACADRVESAVDSAKAAKPTEPASRPSSAAAAATSADGEDGKKKMVEASVSWATLTEEAKNSVIPTAFQLLFQQHAPLKRRFFEDVDLTALAVSLRPLLDQFVDGTLTDEAIRSTGVVQAALEKGVQAYHVQYGATSLLMALSITFGGPQWKSGVAGGWGEKVPALEQRVSTMISDAEAAVAPPSTINEAEL